MLPTASHKNSHLSPRPAVAPHVTAVSGVAKVLSQDVARHFGKSHKNVLRAIESLLPQLPPDFNRLNFEPVEIPDAKGELRPAYRLTRNGFVLLVMGFTGQRALQFKLAYIAEFDRMETLLLEQRVSPLIAEEAFRRGIKLDVKLKLQEQSRRVMALLLAEPARPARVNLYWQLRQVNDTLGLPTQPLDTLVGTETPALEASPFAAMPHLGQDGGVR